MIYVLLLQEQKFYVGYTERENGARFLEHFSGEGSEWTKKYPPIEVIEWRQGTKEDERSVTLEMMEKYGWYNVRGAGWCQVEMIHPPKEIMSRINMPVRRAEMKQTITVCSKCGRDSHTADKCYAKTTITGQEIIKCTRCGRDSHTADKCYARTAVTDNTVKTSVRKVNKPISTVSKNPIIFSGPRGPTGGTVFRKTRK